MVLPWALSMVSPCQNLRFYESIPTIPDLNVWPSGYSARSCSCAIGCNFIFQILPMS